MSACAVDPEQPRVVVYQYDQANAMNPRGLLVAYEENGRVQPVASDFDAFLFGSRGVAYPPTPTWQLPFLESMVLHTQAVLQQPDGRSWTHRWLDVLKGKAEARTEDGHVYDSAIAGSLGKKRTCQPDRTPFWTLRTPAAVYLYLYAARADAPHAALTRRRFR